MMKIWNVTIPELTGDEERRAYVYVPDSYEQDPTKRYPVLYMFDGHNVFFDDHATYGKSWGMKKYMDETQTQLIIAAVECNHHPDNGRLSEYSPYSFTDPKLGSITGRGRITMDWMIHTFKPMIDREYPTLPDRRHTYIAGSSMGGLMSLFAVLDYNHVYSRAACLSPSIWFAADQLSAMIRKAKVGDDTVVYMDYGSREMRHHANMERQYGLVAKELYEKRVMLNSRIVPWGNHCEASWERQIPYFLGTLLYERD